MREEIVQVYPSSLALSPSIQSYRTCFVKLDVNVCLRQLRLMGYNGFSLIQVHFVATLPFTNQFLAVDLQARSRAPNLASRLKSEIDLQLVS